MFTLLSVGGVKEDEAGKDQGNANARRQGSPHPGNYYRHSIVTVTFDVSSRKARDLAGWLVDVDRGCPRTIPRRIAASCAPICASFARPRRLCR